MSASALPLYGGVIFLTALVSGLVPLYLPSSQEKYLKLFVSLGAGLLLGMAFFHMLPEASEFLPHAFGGWFLLGFLLLFFLERFIMVHACEETHCDYHTIGVAAFFGLTVHGLIEGFALASTFYISSLAPLVLFAVLTHKIPSAFALASILKLGNRSRKESALFIAGVAASVPLGIAIATFLLASDKIHSISGVLLSVSAGTFLYIGACDLLPELHHVEEGKWTRLLCFLIGLVLSFASQWMVG